jgi:hypothetical protein
MKLILTIFFTFLGTVFQPSEPDITELRALLVNGADNKESGEKLFSIVGDYSGQNALFLAYKAAAHAIKAKYAVNPLKKKKFIKNSSSIFSDAVARDQQNLEIRYIRFVVETKTPAKVKLSQHLEEDKNILVQAIRDYPKSGFAPDMARLVRDFLKQNCKCSEEEIKALDQKKLEDSSKTK